MPTQQESQPVGEILSNIKEQRHYVFLNLQVFRDELRKHKIHVNYPWTWKFSGEMFKYRTGK